MKELYCVILQIFLKEEKVYLEADDISVDDDGVRLFQGEQCVGFFSREIFRGAFKQANPNIEGVPISAKAYSEIKKAEKTGRIDQEI